MKPKKYNKLVNITKKKQTRRHREQTSGYQWGVGGGQYGGVGGTDFWEKIGYKVYCATQCFVITVNGV